MIEDSVDIICAKKIFSSFDYATRLGDSKVSELINIAIEHGRSKALGLKRKYQGADDIIQKICQDEVLTVNWEKKPSGNASCVKFADCAVKDKTITLNGHAINLIADNCEDLEYNRLLRSVIWY